MELTAGLDDPEAAHDRRWATLAVLCLSLVLIVAGVSSLNVAIPTLVRELDATASELQWMVDAYALVFAGLLLPAGALGDRFGRKGALQFGLVVYLLAALVSTLATSPGQLIAMRAVMGAGAAFVMPATLSIITNVFPPHERGKAIAIWSGFAGAGGAIGPLMSGLLLEQFWWGSVFFINVPIALAALVLGAVLVPTSRDPKHTRLDPVGSLLSIGGLLALLYAIIEAPDRGWTDPLVLVGFGAAAFLLAGFVAWESKNDHPMLPMSYFRIPRFSAGSLAIFVAFFAMFGLFFLLTQYLQFVKGYSALEAAVRTLPLAAMLIIVSPRSAGLADRIGPKKVVAGGLVVLAAGFAVISTVTPDSGYLVIVVALVLMGGGMAGTLAVSTTNIMASLPLAKAGVGSAVNDTTREVGGSIGIAVLGSLLSVGYRSSIEADLTGLPEEAREIAQDSIGGALGVAGQAPTPELSGQLVVAANSAFTDAFSVSMLVAGIVALVGAAIVGWFMPSTAPEQHTAEDELAEAAATGGAGDISPEPTAPDQPSTPPAGLDPAPEF